MLKFPGETLRISDQRELNGTRLMVHAGNCRQSFAVFRCFFAVFRFFPRKFQSLGRAVFRRFSFASH